MEQLAENSRELDAPKKPSRLYAAAWLILKEKKAVSLRVAPHLVRTVRKAVRKEKNLDVAFKFLQSEKGARKLVVVSSYNSKNWKLSFSLVETTVATVDDI